VTSKVSNMNHWKLIEKVDDLLADLSNATEAMRLG